MHEILRRVRSVFMGHDRPRSVEAPPTPAPPPRKANVLLVSPHDADRTLLAQALEGTRWEVLHAQTCEEAASLLSNHVVPVIIRDEECCAKGCEHAVRCAQSGTYPAPVIVASRNPDCRLWEQVIDCGGFEILAKPFEAPRVRKIIDFACQHWKVGIIRRDWDHFDYPD